MKRPHAASITSDSSGQTRYNADRYWGACLFFVRSFGFGLGRKLVASFRGRCCFWLRVRAFQLTCGDYTAGLGIKTLISGFSLPPSAAFAMPQTTSVTTETLPASRYEKG